MTTTSLEDSKFQRVVKAARGWADGIADKFREMDREHDIMEVGKRVGVYLAASTVDCTEKLVNFADRIRRWDVVVPEDRRMDLAAAITAAAKEEGAKDILNTISPVFSSPGFVSIYDFIKERKFSEGDFAIIAKAFDVSAKEKAKRYFSSYPLEMDESKAGAYSRAALFEKSGKVAVFDVESNAFVEREYSPSSSTYRTLSQGLSEVKVGTPKTPKAMAA